MRVTGWPRPSRVDVAWGVFAVANAVAMLRWERWETVPFHFIWVSLTLLYGFRIWRAPPTAAVLALVVLGTGGLILVDVGHGTQEWGELFEVPLMSLMFLAMVFHGRRRQQAMDALEAVAESRASLLEQQERFLLDASHELRTPVTIARGHLDVLLHERGPSAELDVALDELHRIERLVDRLLLLAKAGQPELLLVRRVELEPFLEEVFLRWSEVAPRAWRLAPVAPVAVRADEDALRVALDALLENAVKHTGEGDTIEIGARADGGAVLVQVRDGGCGIPADALERIFERFARADAARTRSDGGAGLGLAIVAAIAKAHGGACTVESGTGGSVFSLRLPAEASAGVAARDVRARDVAGRAAADELQREPGLVP